MHTLHQQLIGDLAEGCRRHYGDRLVSVAVFGSLGRDAAGPQSDVDLLVVVEGLPNGRVKRNAEFAAVEAQVGDRLAQCRAAGLTPEISPVLRTPAEIEAHSPLMLDMVDDARILLDRDRFLEGELARLRGRLAQLGARRVWRGNAWYWDLKPDLRFGEVFEL